MNIIISPSMLASDFARLAEDVKSVESAGADWLHCDVMDGHFVPNISFGPGVVKAIKSVATVPLDVHIMIDNPERYAEAFCKAGADILTFHIEASSDPLALIEQIRTMGVKPAVALSPDTDIEAIDKVLDKVEMVLIMTVHPGFGGQSFMAECLSKVQAIRQKMGEDFLIQVDGGLNVDTVVDATAAGANVIVAGTAIFKAVDRQATIARMRQAGMADN